MRSPMRSSMIQESIIPDEEFIKNADVPGPTKEEIRCLVMCKSEVSKEDVVVDIGCGTGGLTVEFAKRAAQVYAADKNPEALRITKLNLEKFKAENKAQLIKGTAPQVLDDVPDFDILMVGGSSGELPSILEKGYGKLKNGGRIVMTSILLETRVEAIETLLSLGMIPEVVEVSISRGQILKRGTMMKAQNPVTIVSARKIN